MMRLWTVAMLMAATAWGAAFVSWQPAYQLWMPFVNSVADSSTHLIASKKPLPFDEPKLLLAPPLPYQRLVTDSNANLILQQNYFLPSKEFLNAPFALILQANGKNWPLPATIEANYWPKELFLTKNITGVTVLASWPEGASPENVDKMTQALTFICNSWPLGNYPAKILPSP